MVVVKALRVWGRWGSSGTEIAGVVLVHMKTKPKCLNPLISTQQADTKKPEYNATYIEVRYCDTTHHVIVLD